jgi:hypothetical protein
MIFSRACCAKLIAEHKQKKKQMNHKPRIPTLASRNDLASKTNDLYGETNRRCTETNRRTETRCTETNARNTVEERRFSAALALHNRIGL